MHPMPDHFLLALFYLKKYPDKHDLAAFMQSTEKSALKWVKEYVEYIQALKEKKVGSCCSCSKWKGAGF